MRRAPRFVRGFPAASVAQPRVRTGLALLGLLALGCGGLLGATAGCGTKGSACHSKKDCVSGLECAGPNDPRSCGIPPRTGCAASTDCTAPATCHAFSDACSPIGIGSECRASCSGGPACETGFRCSAAGACEPIPCDEGFRCPAQKRCDPAEAHKKAAVSAVGHGCVDVACSDDAGCPAAQACTNGICQDGPGVCQVVIIAP